MNQDKKCKKCGKPRCTIKDGQVTCGMSGFQKSKTHCHGNCQEKKCPDGYLEHLAEDKRKISDWIDRQPPKDKEGLCWSETEKAIYEMALVCRMKDWKDAKKEWPLFIQGVLAQSRLDTLEEVEKMIDEIKARPSNRMDAFWEGVAVAKEDIQSLKKKKL